MKFNSAIGRSIETISQKNSKKVNWSISYSLNIKSSINISNNK